MWDDRVTPTNSMKGKKAQKLRLRGKGGVSGSEGEQGYLSQRSNEGRNR